MSTESPSVSPFLPPLRAIRRSHWLAFFGLVALLGFFVYHPVHRFEFLNFDDPTYLRDNPWLQRGLNWQSFHWALIANLSEFSKRAEYWSPITLLSRLTEAQLFGVNSGAFHVTSALLHCLNALLLAFGFWRLTDKWERSALVGLIFLVHPQNVEPVCWLSARKDVLSATFLFVTLIAYANYVRRQNKGSYLLLLAAYAASLMAKPMGASTPFLLILLDWWPLRRWEAAGSNRTEWMRLLAEKIPLAILAGIAALLAVMSQQDWHAISGEMPFSIRLENALVSYVTYFRRVFWPNDLALFYPHPGPNIPLVNAIGAGAFLVAATIGAFTLRRRAPYVLTGWFWFGLALGPVIGLVQIGSQAMADRYAYPSIVGIFVAVIWGVGELLSNRPKWAGAFAATALAALATCASFQALTFQNSETAFRRALAVTKDNDLAYLNLGCALHDKGDLEGAKVNYLEAVRLNPLSVIAWNNLGLVESAEGNDLAAAKYHRQSILIDPKNQAGLLLLGRIFVKYKDYGQAENLFKRLHDVEPNLPISSVELDKVYTAQARWGDSVQLWTSFMETHPGDKTGQQHLETAIAHQRAASEQASAHPLSGA
ncbi:MAG TPA: hypothetical protein VGH90_04935 [Chthoniobacteraceae bacterium]